METIVELILPVHISAGGLALIAGYGALAARKGGTLHRRAGLLFVLAMVVMGSSGAVVAAVNPASQSVSIAAGLLTCYLVVTSLLTMRDRSGAGMLERRAAVFALAASAISVAAGVQLAGTGRPETAPAFVFGAVALLAGIGDLRAARAGGLQGKARLTRHLWRMCFAMWIAAASFFWGPPGRVPEPLRIPGLPFFAVMVPVFVMLYWIVRMRAKRRTASVAAVAESRLATQPAMARDISGVTTATSGTPR